MSAAHPSVQVSQPEPEADGGLPSPRSRVQRRLQRAMSLSDAVAGGTNEGAVLQLQIDELLRSVFFPALEGG